ncbi:MAG: hypothetical protein R6W92_03280 [Desulfocurvibacter africanus]
MRLATICSSRLLIPILIVAALAQALPAGGQELVEVGSMPYGPCYATALNSARDVAFLGNGSVLQAVDLSYPYDPVLVGELRLTGAVHAMFYGGERLYVANGHGGLRIITMEYEVDEANVVTGVKFTQINPETGLADEGLTDARDLEVLNNYAYIANGRSGLAVVDVQDPSTPKLLGSYPIWDASLGESGEVLDVAVLGGRAYVAAGADGLLIIDVSDPANMQGVTLPSDATPIVATNVSSVTVAGNLLYILDRTAGLSVVDMTNEDYPGQYLQDDSGIPYFDTGGDKISLTVLYEDSLNGTAFVADGTTGISLVDVTDPRNLELMVVSQDTNGYIYHLDTDGSVTRVYATTGYILVADDNGGLRIMEKIDGNPDYLWEVGHYDTPGLASDIAISGEVAYIADGDGVRVYDISSPLAFPELGMVALERDIRGIAASGNYAYVTAPDGVHLIDATTPSTIKTTPIITQGLAIPARKVAVLNDVLSMTSEVPDTDGDPNTDPGSRLCIFDVLEPTKPRELAYKSVTGMGLGLAMDENMTYVIGSDGLYALDRSKLPDAQLRSITTSVPSISTPVRVALSGNFAYVTDAGGLCALNVADAEGLGAREEDRLVFFGSQLTNVAVAGPTEYEAEKDTLHQAAYAVGDNKLHVIDVTRSKDSSGQESVVLTELDPLSLPLDKDGDVLATSGNRVYAIAGAAGVRIYGVDRDAPVANAGADISIFSGFTAYLNAEASTDDVAIMKYNWRCLNSNIEPSDADKTEARFITPRVSEPTQYEFELTVEDKAGRTSTDTMVVTVKPYTGRGESSSGSSGCTLSPEAGFRAEWLFLAGLMAVLRLRRRKR